MTIPETGADIGTARSRRDFLRAAGLTGATLALAACGAEGMLLDPSTSPRFATVDGNTVTLDFSNEIDVLNYAYALEQLEAAFYLTVAANGAFGSIFAANEQRVLLDLRDHEVAHRDFLAAALGSAAIPNLSVDFSSINFASRTSVLNTAQVFEDLGVSAYNGAARYLKSASYLTAAGKIVSVEARHAAAIRDLLANRSGAFAPAAFDAVNTPQTVLAAADQYVVQTINVVNT